MRPARLAGRLVFADLAWPAGASIRRRPHLRPHSPLAGCGRRPAQQLGLPARIRPRLARAHTNRSCSWAAGAPLGAAQLGLQCARILFQSTAARQPTDTRICFSVWPPPRPSFAAKSQNKSRLGALVFVFWPNSNIRPNAEPAACFRPLHHDKLFWFGEIIEP